MKKSSLKASSGSGRKALPAVKPRGNGRSSSHAAGPVAAPAAKVFAGSSRGGFPSDFLAKTSITSVAISRLQDDTVFSQGDAADSVFYIQTGKVKIGVVSKQGKEAIVAVLTEGEFVGEDCIANAHPLRLVTATALTECQLLKIDKKEMIRELSQDRAFADVFVSFLLARNARIQEDLIDQLFNSSEKRLARVLLLLAQFGKEGKPETVVPKLSQESLAEMVGTTRSRVSFFMNRFRKLGFIEYNGEIKVHPSLLNVVLHD
ncbi:MAG: Crp/Fnr family transcriptional regulator [Terriglobales bacterium]